MRFDVVVVIAVSLTFFATIWLGVTALLSVACGWTKVAQRFPAEAPPSGHSMFGQLVAFGRVTERNVTIMTFATEGLYLRALFLFRLMRHPILVPWREIHFVKERKILWLRSYIFDLGGLTTIEVTKKAFDEMSPRLADTNRNSFATSRR